MDERKYIQEKINENEMKFEENENSRGMKNLVGVLLTCLCMVGIIASFQFSIPLAVILGTIGGVSALTTFRNNGIMKEESERLDQKINHLEKIGTKGLNTSQEAKNQRKLRKAKLREEIDELEDKYNHEKVEANAATIVALLSSFLAIVSPYTIVLPLVCLAAGTMEGAKSIGTNAKLQNRENRLYNLDIDSTVTRIKDANFDKKKQANPKLIREIPKLNKTPEMSTTNSKAVDKYLEGLTYTDTTDKAKTYTK